MNSAQQLNALSQLISELRIRTEEHTRATHSNFNVFTTVLLAHDEVRLHTRFLHNLLDPKGTHDCGNLFLNLFIETLNQVPSPREEKQKLIELPSNLHEHTYTVKKEAATSFGQIDLLLEADGYAIAIENKIYAVEQSKQLSRYSQYLESTSAGSNLLIYLTLDGKKSETNESSSYIRISYQDHILTWLEKCLQATYSIIPINQILIQYRHVIQQLTGKTLEQQDMKEISAHLLANPELLKMRTAYNEAVHEVRAVALDLLAEDMLTELRTHHPAELRSGMTGNRFGTDPFASIRISPSLGPFAKSPYSLVIEHIDKWNAIVVGIESKWGSPKLTAGDQLLLSKLNELLIEDAEKNGTHKVEPQHTWHGEYWSTGWHDLISKWFLTDDDLVELLNPQKRKALAQELIEKAVVHIQRLERLHQVAERAIATE